MTNETLLLIDKLAEKLGTTSNYLWTILVGQAKVYVIGTTIQYLVIFAVIYIWLKLIKHMIDKWDEIKRNDSELFYIIGFVTSLVVIIPLFFLAFDEINNYITAILNPEAYALEQILKNIK